MSRFTPARNRFTAMLVVPSAIALAASIIWSALLVPDLPDPVATHFDFTGTADGFGSAAGSIAGLSGIAAAMLVMFAVMALAGMSSGAMSRVLAGFGSGSVFLLAALQVALLLPQRGLDDARGFTLPFGYLAVPFLIAIAGGAAVALLIDPIEEPEDTVPPADPIAVTEASRAVWFGRARASWVLFVALAAGVPACAVPAVIAHRGGETLIAVLLFIGAVALALLTAAFASVRVRVDSTGVHWRLVPGLPERTVEYGDLDDVSAVELKAGDWGGWGYRLGPKGKAILLRGGEGLRLSRRKGADMYISVDDAARGAELARGYLRRG